jgi:hypothetical protein
MGETKYGKYILSEYKPPAVEAPWSPPDLRGIRKGKGGRVFYLDSSIMPGAFYMECVWVMPSPVNTPLLPGDRRVGTEPHTHDYDEVIAFIGTDHDDPYNLHAEVELGMGDEIHKITKTCLIFIPAGLKHGPLTFLRVDRPVYHYTTGPAKMYF